MSAPLTVAELFLIQGALEDKIDWLGAKKAGNSGSQESFWHERIELATAALEKVNELIKAA